MNLNSYIGLMGGSYREVRRPRRRPCTAAHRRRCPTSTSPTPTTSSRSTPTACCCPSTACGSSTCWSRPSTSDVAVAQTPYSAFPGAATRLERIAGATTDLQHIVHQGMTHYDATFWVGANAVLRKRALDDIAEVDHDGDCEIRRYIPDRTVIEDTESSIDLGVHGWRLLNYPERLSYSATPPDFGSLCIQRQRWANGGLLILPSLWRQIRAGAQRGERQRFGEMFLRVNYMASICVELGRACSSCWCTRSTTSCISPIVLLIAIPYFVMMAIDLKHCGYSARDVLRIYGFNLILLPVNLSGVGASLVQVLIGGRPRSSARRRCATARRRASRSSSCPTCSSPSRWRC